ncbi:MAG TPA: hypothetical protein VIL32_11795 [Steroidobacteraceae bacterium]
MRIALADDQALVREGLEALLRDLGVEVVLEAADGQSLLDRMPSVAVDVIVGHTYARHGRHRPHARITRVRDQHAGCPSHDV